MDFPGKERLPRLGVGLSFRTEIASALHENIHEFDFVEMVLDNVLQGLLDPKFSSLLGGCVPLVGHGVNASIGSLEPIDTDYLSRVNEISGRMHCRWFSEHLAFTRSEQWDVGQLMPVQFCADGIAFIAGKIRALASLLDVPLLIENIAYYFTIPGSTLTEIDFLLGVLEAARCGLLLDVNNLYANALNHGYDPYAFIDRLPSAAVVEIHVAGGEHHNGLYIDTHGHPVNSEVLALVDYAIATKKPNAIVLEREKNYPPMQELVSEVRELRRLWTRHYGGAAALAM